MYFNKNSIAKWNWENESNEIPATAIVNSKVIESTQSNSASDGDQNKRHGFSNERFARNFIDGLCRAVRQWNSVWLYESHTQRNQRNRIREVVIPWKLRLSGILEEGWIKPSSEHIYGWLWDPQQSQCSALSGNVSRHLCHKNSLQFWIQEKDRRERKRVRDNSSPNFDLQIKLIVWNFKLITLEIWWNILW